MPVRFNINLSLHKTNTKYSRPCPAQTPCPVCPPAPVPCTATNSVVNPGFEAGGGTLQPWVVSDPTVVVIDSQNGVQDPLGLHSAQFILGPNMLTGWISQNVTVCPSKAYKIYFAVKLLGASANPGVLPTDQGKFIDKSQCNIFVSLSQAGSSTVMGSNLQSGMYTTITTTNSFTTGNVTNANLMISVVCSSAAFGANPTAGQNGYMYFDNINLLPQPLPGVSS